MTLIFQRFDADTGLLADEDMLPHIVRWQSEGLRTALVTLVGVEGGAPRQPGAQMAVAEDGRSAGYLSGGCLEAAVVLEAQAAMRAGKNRLVRYGKDSPYFDIKLPCGSGLDLYFDQHIAAAQVQEILNVRVARQTCALRTSLVDGTSVITATGAQSLRQARERKNPSFAITRRRRASCCSVADRCSTLSRSWLRSADLRSRSGPPTRRPGSRRRDAE